MVTAATHPMTLDAWATRADDAPGALVVARLLRCLDIHVDALWAKLDAALAG